MDEDEIFLDFSQDDDVVGFPPLDDDFWLGDED